MKLKILVKCIFLSAYIMANHATASIATQAERFMRRPVLHNFIQHMHFEDRWQPFALTTFPHKQYDSIATPSTLHTRPTMPAPNFILPGFGLYLDSFFLHDSIGTERCEDAIRAETVDIDGITTTYLSVAYCLGAREKTFILGANRTSIVHIYKYENNVLSSTYTALCPVRAEFGCHLNGHGGDHGREKEITLNNKVAQAPDFNEGHYNLDSIKEYLRQVAHIMIDTKEKAAHHTERAHASTHYDTDHHATAYHGTAHHGAAQEGHFYHYDIAFHMANLVAGRNGLSERLYRRGVSALLAQQTTTTDRSPWTSREKSDGYTTAEDSDVSIASHRGRSTKECAGQIMRVCGFSTDFLITSWNKRDITSVLEQCGINIANGRCILDEKRSEFALIKSLHAEFTGVVPYFFDDERLFNAIYERGLNYSALIQSINSPKRKMEEHKELLVRTIMGGGEEQLKKRKKKLRV